VADLAAVHERLQDILAPYRKSLAVTKDGPDVPGVPYNHVLEAWFMVNPDKILDGIGRLAAY
jgi:hypothetical protein